MEVRFGHWHKQCHKAVLRIVLRVGCHAGHDQATSRYSGHHGVAKQRIYHKKLSVGKVQWAEYGTKISRGQPLEGERKTIPIEGLVAMLERPNTRSYKMENEAWDFAQELEGKPVLGGSSKSAFLVRREC